MKMTQRVHKRCGSVVTFAFFGWWSCPRCNSWVAASETEERPILLV